MWRVCSVYNRLYYSLFLLLLLWFLLYKTTCTSITFSFVLYISLSTCYQLVCFWNWQPALWVFKNVYIVHLTFKQNTLKRLVFIVHCVWVSQKSKSELEVGNTRNGKLHGKFFFSSALVQVWGWKFQSLFLVISFSE